MVFTTSWYVLSPCPPQQQRSQLCNPPVECGAHTNFSEDVAINALKQFEWNLEVACDNYFANPDAFAVKTKAAAGKKASGPVDPAKIDSLFETYRGRSP